MNPFARLRMSIKLPVAILVLALGAMMSVGVPALLAARDMARTAGISSLSVVVEAAADDLADWAERNRTWVAAAASDPSITQGLATLRHAYDVLPGEAEHHLREWYVDRGGQDGARGHLLDRAGDDSAYSAAHAIFHPRFRGMASRQGFADLLLVTREGEVVYSVQKRSDFGSSVLTGSTSSTALAEVFRSALTIPVGQTLLTDLASYAPSGVEAVAFLAAPVPSPGGDIEGVLIVQLSTEPLMEILRSAKGLGDTGDLYLVASDGLTRSLSRFDGRLEILSAPPALPQVGAATLGQAEVMPDSMGLAGQPVIAVVQSADIDDLDWSIVAERDQAEVDAAHDLTGWDPLSYLMIGAVVAAGLSWAVARVAIAPLTAITAFMLTAADKRHVGLIPGEKRSDEIGDLAHALAALCDELARLDALSAERDGARARQDWVISEIRAALDRLAAGDLTHPIESAFEPEYEGLRENINSIMLNLSLLLSQVVARAAEISQKAQEISSASDDMSRRTENQAATLEETAAALDQLTASVKSSAQGASEVDDVVNKARGDAEQSGAVVRNAVAAMAEIERSSGEISQIIGVIDDIAFQTNLLALNAGVEAARAGEAGKGFAVVASEVRTLAQRSSDAARQIKVLIGGSTRHVQQGVDLVGRAGDVLTSIVERVAHISELVSEIASGTKEQAMGLSEINGGVNQLDQVTQQNAAMVDQSTAASHKLTEDARQLAKIVAPFRLRVGGSVQKSSAAEGRSNSEAAEREAQLPATSPPAVPRLAATAGRPLPDQMWDDF